MESMDLFFENKLPLFGLTQQVGSFVVFFKCRFKAIFDTKPLAFSVYNIYL